MSSTQLNWQKKCNMDQSSTQVSASADKDKRDRSIVRRTSSLHLPKSIKSITPEHRLKNSKLHAKRKLGAHKKNNTCGSPVMDAHLMREQLARQERERVEFEENKSRFNARTEQRRKMFTKVESSCAVSPSSVPVAGAAIEQQQQQQQRRGRGRNRLMEVLAQRENRNLRPQYQSSFPSPADLSPSPEDGLGDTNSSFSSGALLYPPPDSSLDSLDQYSMPFEQPSFHTISRMGKEFNSDQRIRSPFVASTYRRLAEEDEGWFTSQTGAECSHFNQSLGHPECEGGGLGLPPLTLSTSGGGSVGGSPDGYYRTSIDINTSHNSFMSVRSDGTLAVVQEGHHHEHYDSFDFDNEDNDHEGRDKSEGGRGAEEKQFLDRMESSLFSFENQGDASDSITETDMDTIPYDGTPKDEHYFGEEARTSFFALYQRLSRRGLHNAPPSDTKAPIVTSLADRRMSRRASSLMAGTRTGTGASAGVGYSSSKPQGVSGLPLVEEANESHSGEDDEESDTDSMDELDINLDIDLNNADPEAADDLDADLDRPLSPRHRFLLRIISEGKVPPLPIIIRHHKSSHELNLAHRALGDDYIIYLSAVVHDLPALTKLNLRDNRLTDRGMGVFIHALAGQQHIVDVDISENKIDSASADALTHYLKDPLCKLTKLRMANADLDDDEIAIFMNALETNESIIEMDVSHNLLGGRGEKTTKNMNINAENLVGGASVAAALKHNNTLLNLDLSWNKLGLASSTHLGYALALNDSLTSINLAYNTIRDDGAEIIGSSLASNTALRVLNLSSNGIGPQGMVVISTGLRLCEGLERLDISGNPIGRQGVSSLLQTLNYHSVHRSFNLSDCVFDDSGPKTVVDLEFPTGKYSLDLSKPSNRCIVLELYLLASMKRGVKLKSIDYKGVEKNSKKVPVTLIRPENPCKNMGQPYSPYRGSTPRPHHPYTQLEAREWMEVADGLSLIDETTGEKWSVPLEGTVFIDCVCSPQLSTPIECLNATGIGRLIALVADHPKQFLQILSQCHNLVMESHQLDSVLNSLSSLGLLKQRTEVMSALLPCCGDTSNVPPLLEHHLPKIESIKDVQFLLRNMYYLCVNSVSGHYTLDMDIPLDRRAALRLMAISAHENGYIKNTMTWGPTHLYTSQQGTRTNFRNETFRNIPLESGLTASFFSLGLKDRSHGVLEFDFVSITRPEEGCAGARNTILEGCLDARGLIYPLVALSSSVLRTRRKALHGGEREREGSGGGGGGGVMGRATINRAMSDFVSVIATGVDAVSELEEVLGPHVQSESSRITTGGPLPCPVVEFHQYAAKSPHMCLEDMNMEDLTMLNSQLNTDTAMFFDGGKHMEKYTISLVIRLQSSTGMMLLEPTAVLTRLTENGKFGFSGQGKNEESKLSINDILSVDSYIDTVKFDTGLMANPSSKVVKPTHKRYVLRDDIVVAGSEIFVEVKCPLWSMHKIVEKTKEVVATFFSCLGMTETHVKIMNHKVAETKFSQFSGGGGAGPGGPGPGGVAAAPASPFSNCNTRLIAHQVDVSVDGLPETDDMLVKTSSKSSGTGYNNIVWRWRVRTQRDRGSGKVDLSLSCHDYWGVKILHLRTLLGGMWVTCQQAAFIASRFPQFGSDGHPVRETAIVVLFSRVVDVENFYEVIKTLPPDSYCGVYRRVGWLNAINPHEVDYLFNLDLSKADERLLAATLSKFSAVEPGDNVLEPRYRRSHQDLFIFGWDVPASWCVDPDKARQSDGVPKRGQMVGTYCSSADMGCKKVPWVREEYNDRFFLMAVPRCPSGEDFYIHTTAEKKWDV